MTDYLLITLNFVEKSGTISLSTILYSSLLHFSEVEVVVVALLASITDSIGRLLPDLALCTHDVFILR